MMLQRNLLYTGITRARKLLVLAGSRRALAQAVRTRGAGRRHTALTHRLNPGDRHTSPKLRQWAKGTPRGHETSPPRNRLDRPGPDRPKRA
jgi:hypothetical protein